MGERFDFLLNNLVAAVERRDQLTDIERERLADISLFQGRIENATASEYHEVLDAFQEAKERRQAADQSVLSIAADLADEWRQK